MNLILCKHELFMLIQFSVRMTEAMQPMWPSYQSQYCLHKSGEVCTQFHNFGTHGAFYTCHSSTRHVHNLPIVHLPRQRRTLGTAFISCRVRWAMHAIRGKTTTCTLVAQYGLHETSTRSVHNSRKNQLYTYLAWENRPSRFIFLFFIFLFLSNVRSNFT